MIRAINSTEVVYDFDQVIHFLGVIGDGSGNDPVLQVIQSGKTFHIMPGMGKGDAGETDWMHIDEPHEAIEEMFTSV